MYDSSDASERTKVTNEQRSTLHSVSRSPSIMNDVREPKSNIEDVVRVILALSTVPLVVLAFVAFFISGNILVLLGSTVVGIAVTRVFGYFFRKDDK